MVLGIIPARIRASGQIYLKFVPMRIKQALAVGVIAVAPDGQMAWSFNTPGMFRAKLAEGGTAQVGIYRDEP